MANTYKIEERESYPQWLECDECGKRVQDSIHIHQMGFLCLSCVSGLIAILEAVKMRMNHNIILRDIRHVQL